LQRVSSLRTLLTELLQNFAADLALPRDNERVQSCHIAAPHCASRHARAGLRMSFSDALQVAVEALIANKLRAALTMLGIVIGVGAVIALMAVCQGSQKAVSSQILGLGSNLVFIR